MRKLKITKISGEIYQYIPLKGDGKNVAKALEKMHKGEIPFDERKSAIMNARYLDFLEEKRNDPRI